MKIFLAGVTSDRLREIGKKANSLISFAFLKPDSELDMSMFNDFILDSGAYTFAFGSSNKKRKLSWDQYCSNYIKFIKRNKIKNYMELDIDRLVGYDRVKELRRRCEEEVGWPPIPVWHVNRGLKDWVETCKRYKFVAIGGLRQEIGKKRFHLLDNLIDEAHRHNAKVHGLGFTRPTLIEKNKCMFDTVDSTTWASGAIYCRLVQFNGKTLVPFSKRNRREICTLSTIQRRLLGLDAWVSYANYIERTTEYYAK